MKNILLLGIVGFIIYYLFIPSAANRVFNDDGSLELSNSSTRAILYEDAEIDLDLRLYSIDSSKESQGLFSLIDHAFFVTPFSNSRHLYKKYVNENMPLNKPTMVQILAENDDINTKILNFKKDGHECVDISAVAYSVDKLYFKDELVTNFSSSGHSFDPMKMLLITDFQPNNCK